MFPRWQILGNYFLILQLKLSKTGWLSGWLLWTSLNIRTSFLARILLQFFLLLFPSNNKDSDLFWVVWSLKISIFNDNFEPTSKLRFLGTLQFNLLGEGVIKNIYCIYLIFVFGHVAMNEYIWYSYLVISLRTYIRDLYSVSCMNTKIFFSLGQSWTLKLVSTTPHPPTTRNF